MPLVLILVLLSGIGPVIAWRRASPSRLWRSVRGPVFFTALVGVLLVAFTNATDDVASFLLFVVASFAIAVAVQELWRGMRARQLMTGDGPAGALTGLVKRNRRRYGGYIVHIGISVVFIGVAASSAFQHERDVRLGSGQSVTVGGYVYTNVRPTAKIEQRAGELERISLGSTVRVTKDGKQVALLQPNRGYYPANAPMVGVLSRYFIGESTSEIGLKAGARRDLWVAMQPDISALLPIIRRGDAVFARAAKNGLGERARSLFLAPGARRPRAALSHGRSRRAVPHHRLAADRRGSGSDR